MAQNTSLSYGLRARVALEKHGFHNTHSLGQNFLLDEELLSSLLEAAEVGYEDRVLEIGPGPGVMTGLLADRCAEVLALEVDRALEPVLSDVLSNADNVRVVFQDALKADIASLMGEKPFRVVANLPYYITADILLRLVTAPVRPESICIMVQREAAERIMSEPGQKSWCALAATVRCYGRATVLRDVPSEAFDPPPHVQSQFIRFDRHATPVAAPTDEQRFFRVIQAAFAMRRKTLANNLKAAFGLSQQQAQTVLERAGVDARVRGEALTLEELCRVAEALS